MKDEHPHIVATCRQCGFKFDALFGLDCPQCRMAAVQKAFRPLDVLRTALAVQGVRWHGSTTYYYKPDLIERAEETEVPQGCKMPQGREAQVYELKRMRKLIGRL